MIFGTFAQIRLNFLYLVPDDLIGLKCKLKARPISPVHGSGLGFIGIIHNTVFLIFNIGMDLHVEVSAVPITELVFIMRRPQD